MSYKRPRCPRVFVTSVVTNEPSALLVTPRHVDPPVVPFMNESPAIVDIKQLLPLVSFPCSSPSPQSDMSKEQPPSAPSDLKSVKPTARKRAALAKASASRARRSAQNTTSATLLHTEAPGLLQPENDLERTYKLRQPSLLPSVDPSTQSKASFALDLSSSGLSPYHTATYSRSGTSLLLASVKGHVAVTDWRTAQLRTELFLNETVRAATFLHSDAFFALAQRRFAYIYDAAGAQLHVLRNHREPSVLRFLPHHMLLASASAPEAPHSKLVYTDTTTGSTVAELDFGGRRLKLGAARHGSVNHANGVLHMAHAAGVVSLWSPAAPRPLAQIFTHGGGVRQVAVAPNGKWMVTAGADCMVKTWDLRTYKCTATWRVPAQTSGLHVSQRGLVGLAFGAKAQVWMRGKEGWGRTPYMSQPYPGKKITGVEFCPFEDLMAVCWEGGVQKMVVPGAGEAVFDSAAPNPYETRNQRREREVKTLLDKLPMGSIMLDTSDVGGVEKDGKARLKEIRERGREANAQKRSRKMEVKRAKGRNKISKRLRRKQANVIDEKRLAMQEKLEQERKTREAAKKVKEQREKEAREGVGEGGISARQVPDALKRFLPKKER